MNTDERADYEQPQAEERHRAEADAAWKAWHASIEEMYSSRARGYGSGQTYEYHGPEATGSDGKYHREQRLK